MSMIMSPTLTIANFQNIVLLYWPLLQQGLHRTYKPYLGVGLHIADVRYFDGQTNFKRNEAMGRYCYRYTNNQQPLLGGSSFLDWCQFDMGR